jgi:DNA polymerase III subunit epsilon
MSTVSESLSQLEVLVVDCQATAAAPHGHLLEMGWARAGTTTTRADARLIALPDGEHIPAAVMRLTGISERMAQGGVDAHVAWRELSDDAATLARQPAPTVIHFARFEQPFLRALAGEELPLDILCTHDIARRLLPDLPRCGVRALAGYFGRGVGALRRSADHVEATAFVWRELVRLLRNEGISTWSVLQEWLADSRAPRQRRRRVWPMPRNVRLSLPDAPGVYRMLRTSGDVLSGTTPQREYWNGQPVELETVWRLSKNGKVARLLLRTHQLGWELRIDSGDLLLTQGCRSDREIEDVAGAWKAAMIEKGWSE